MKGLLLGDLCRIGEDRSQLLIAQVGIVGKDLFLGPTSGEQTKQEVDRQTSASDDRLAPKDRRICVDVILPVHAEGG